MKVISYLGIYFFPAVFIGLGEFISYLCLSDKFSKIYRVSVYAGIGLVTSLGIYLVIRYSFDILELKPIYFGGLSSFFKGIGLGVSVCLISGISLGLVRGYSFNFRKIFNNMHLHILSMIFPAFTEEFFFRGGIAEATAQLYGNTWGLIAGSIPFAIMHMAGRLVGRTVGPTQVIGTGVAGFFLCLTYFKYGIWASIGSHWAWNSFVSGWGKVYEIENVADSFEGDWVSILILVLASLILFYEVFPVR